MENHVSIKAWKSLRAGPVLVVRSVRSGQNKNGSIFAKGYGFIKPAQNHLDEDSVVKPSDMHSSIFFRPRSTLGNTDLGQRSSFSSFFICSGHLANIKSA